MMQYILNFHKRQWNINYQKEALNSVSGYFQYPNISISQYPNISVSQYLSIPISQ